MLDRYANAFNKTTEEEVHWMSDNTEMKPGLHERKWEIDSLETFHKDDPANFTRSWFAWANTLFGELVLKLISEGKEKLLVG